MKNKGLIFILAAVAGLLMIPLIAMIFTDEVDWSGGDFLIMGTLLLGTGLLCQLAIKKVTGTGYKILLCAAILVAFFLVWAELAVGIFGTSFAGS